MRIQVQCSKCGKSGSIDQSRVGTSFSCPGCGALISTTSPPLPASEPIGSTVVPSAPITSFALPSPAASDPLHLFREPGEPLYYAATRAASIFVLGFSALLELALLLAVSRMRHLGTEEIVISLFAQAMIGALVIFAGSAMVAIDIARHLRKTAPKE